MRVILAAWLIALSATTAGQARPPIESVIDTIAKVHAFAETAVSPDGRRVAWVEDLTPSGDGGPTAIWVKELPSGKPYHVTAAPTPAAAASHESGLAWSPDGKSLAFLSDARTPGQSQIFVTWRFSRDAPLAGRGSPLMITHAKGQLDHPRWAPDGKRIAFLYVAGSSQAAGALVAYKPDAGVVGEETDEQRIAIADVASGAIKEVSPANMWVYDYDWSPDGTWFAAEAVEGSGTNNYWTAQLYRVEATGGATKSIWKPALQIAVPRVSPDGRSVALIHGIMSDEGSNGGDVYRIAVEDGRPLGIMGAAEGSARSLTWTARGDLVFQEYRNGETRLNLAEVQQVVDSGHGSPGSVERDASLGSVQVTALSASRDGSIVAGVVQSFDAAPEVYAGARGTWTKQTSTNAAIKRQWGDAKSLHWKSDRFTVQGWLLYPLDFDPSRKYPMVVSVHGGPSSANFPTFPQRWNAVLPSQGYFVLLPNPRGSYGAGAEFTQANVKDFGYGDLRDILAGIDAAAKEAPIDTNRVGIIGWSYGGYMTMWAVTQTNRFKAAVAGAGIANWQSYYGQNRIDQWMLPFFGASVYDAPEVYARSSPMTFIKQAKTPTLVLHGDRDSEVPTPQGYEFWHALKTLRVPTELVIYENEGHAIGKPEHQRDIQRRLVGWFDKYLQ
jgi:dipeptidyl aminopeptidase/acylaminoacyl peptidase